jgi:hypothetical protein
MLALGKSKTLSEKQLKQKRAGDVAQFTEHLSRKYKALSSKSQCHKKIAYLANSTVK